MFKMLKNGVGTGSTKLIAAYRAFVITLAFWAPRDERQHDPLPSEIGNVLTIIPIPTEYARVEPDTLCQKLRQVLPGIRSGIGDAFSIQRHGSSLHFGWNRDMKEGPNETQDVRYAS